LNAGGVGTNCDCRKYLAIDQCLLEELVWSTYGHPCSSVSQLRCTSVYGTGSHAAV